MALLETRVIYPPPASGATKGIVWAFGGPLVRQTFPCPEGQG
jgi:hypothetical protein